MNKLLVTMTLVAFFAATFGLAIAVTSIAHGRAPNAGDGVPDGSGFEDPHNMESPGSINGPAPNSNDGIPDGSGMESPFGSHSEGPEKSGKGNAPEGKGSNSHGGDNGHGR